MSDERDLTPEQEAHVARLLADARVEEPLPPEVAARLDRVLDGLAGEPVAGPAPAAPVAALAARRRRQVRTLLVAAAAVVVAGVGVGQLVEPRDSGDSGGTSSLRADDEAAEPHEEAPSPDAASGGDHSRMSEDELKELGEPARISADRFAASVRRLQDRPGVRGEAAPGMMDDSDLAAPDMDFSCGAADYGGGKLIAVRYQGTPAVLAYRPATGGTQVVELLQCGSGEVIRSTTVPLP